jgi:two-component system NtrC family sensor kinase
MKMHTILCVDDEENILSALERVFLEEDNYEIITANSGNEGLKILKERPVDLIMSDQRMPEMSGTEFLKKARALYPDTIRIVLSGFSDFDTVTKAINEGEIYRLIQKPWEDSELLSVVKDCLEKYTLICENKKLQEAIKKQNEELKTFNLQLEEKVKERTQELILRNQVLSLSQEMLHHVSTAIIGISSDETIVLINKQAQDICESNGKPVIGKDVEEIFSEDVANVVRETFQVQKPHIIENVNCNHHQVSLRCMPLTGQYADKGAILEITVRDES